MRLGHYLWVSSAIVLASCGGGDAATTAQGEAPVDAMALDVPGPLPDVPLADLFGGSDGAQAEEVTPGATGDAARMVPT